MKIPINQNITVLPADDHDKPKLGWVLYEGPQKGPSYHCACEKCKKQEEWETERSSIRILEGHRAILWRVSLYTREQIQEKIEADPEDFPQDIIDKIWELKGEEQ